MLRHQSVLLLPRPAAAAVEERPVRGEAAVLDHVADGLGPERRDVEAQCVDVPAAPAREPDDHAAVHRVRERHALVVPEGAVHLPAARRERQRPEHGQRPAVRLAVAAAHARHELVGEVQLDLQPIISVAFSYTQPCHRVVIDRAWTPGPCTFSVRLRLVPPPCFSPCTGRPFRSAYSTVSDSRDRP